MESFATDSIDGAIAALENGSISEAEKFLSSLPENSKNTVEFAFAQSLLLYKSGKLYQSYDLLKSLLSQHAYHQKAALLLEQVRPAILDLVTSPMASLRAQRVDSSFIEMTSLSASGSLGPLGSYIFPKICLLGQFGFFVSRDGTVIREQNYGPDPLESLVENSNLLSRIQDLPTLSGDYCSLCSPWAHGFYHWMLDSLPKILVAEECGFRGTYFIPLNCSFAAETLELYGIEKSRIQLLPAPGVMVERLWVPTHVYPMDLRRYPELLGLLRDRLLDGAKSRKMEPLELPERIFLSRRPPAATRRIVVNEEELMSLLGPFGFKLIQAEKLSVTGQIQLFSKARIVIGPHGAGMVNTLYMPPQSWVIELFSPHYVNPAVFSILELMKHRYSMVVGQNFPGWPYQYGEHIFAELQHLKVLLGTLDK